MIELFGLLPSVASLWMLSSLTVVAEPILPVSVQTQVRTLQRDAETRVPSPMARQDPQIGRASMKAEKRGDTPLAQTSNSIAQVESIELAADGNQLLIRVDGPIAYSSGWESALFYTITITGARLNSGVTAPRVDASTTIARVQVEQAGPETVTIRVQPKPQVQVQEVNQPSPEMLALYLQSYSASPPRTPLWPDLDDEDLTLSPAEDGQILVVLDPGHGGADPGAVGIGGLNEVEIVDPVADRVAELLEANGVAVVLTRTEDIEVDLPPRVDLANRLDANLFVSIHANAVDMSRPEINGIETYYYSAGEQLAEMIHASLLDASGGPDRRVRTARFYVLRNTDMPAVLLELGFVTGELDAERLSDPDYRNLLAEAIARGILQYIQRYCPGPLCRA